MGEKSCKNCYKSISGRPDPRTDDRGPDSCWMCCRLSNWELDAMRYEIVDNTVGVEDLEIGKHPMTKGIRPKYTVWNPKTVRNDIKRRVRSRRRIFKQYLKTGGLRLLNAAERKLTSWDFD